MLPLLVHFQTHRKMTSRVPSVHPFLCPVTSELLWASVLNPKFERSRNVFNVCSCIQMRNIFRKKTMMDQHLNYLLFIYFCVWNMKFLVNPGIFLYFFYPQGKHFRVVERTLGLLENKQVVFTSHVSWGNTLNSYEHMHTCIYRMDITSPLSCTELWRLSVIMSVKMSLKTWSSYLF